MVKQAVYDHHEEAKTALCLHRRCSTHIRLLQAYTKQYRQHTPYVLLQQSERIS